MTSTTRICRRICRFATAASGFVAEHFRTSQEPPFAFLDASELLAFLRRNRSNQDFMIAHTVRERVKEQESTSVRAREQENNR